MIAEDVFGRYFSRGSYLVPEELRDQPLLEAMYRNAVMNHIFLRRTPRVDDVRSYYLRTGSLLRTAARFDVPPYLLCKLLGLPQREKDLAARWDDFTSPEAHERAARGARRFERALGRKLRRCTDEPLRSEPDLREEGAALTPDFLVGGRVWVEAKNFYGGSNAFTRHVVGKQVKKYAAMWGPGHVVFRWGADPALQFPGRATVHGFETLDCGRLGKK